MGLLVVEDAYEETRKSGLLNMTIRQGVQELAAYWSGPDRALARLTAEYYYKLLCRCSDWQAEKEVR